MAPMPPRAFISTAGEPNYANAGPERRANTHQRHVSGAADCVNCHINTVDGTGKLTGGGHTNGSIEVTFNPAKAGTGVTWTGAKTCSNIQCHGTGSASAQWGATSCLGCHTAGAGDASSHRRAIRGQLAPYSGSGNRRQVLPVSLGGKQQRQHQQHLPSFRYAWSAGRTGGVWSGRQACGVQHGKLGYCGSVHGQRHEE